MSKRPASLNIDIDLAIYQLELLRERIEWYEPNNNVSEWSEFITTLSNTIKDCERMKSVDMGEV